MKAAPTSNLLAAPVLQRMSALASLDDVEIGLVRSAARMARHHRAHREVPFDGRSYGGQVLLLSGWACQARTFADGRRQIINVLLAGDLVGAAAQYEPIDSSSIVALTDIMVCPAPVVTHTSHPGLNEAYARSRALREAYLFRQVARLGRLNAYERVADWFLEIRERLALAGLANGDRYSLPMTQEALGDTLGLTSVHVNRTLQAMRREGLVEWKAGTMHLLDRERMASIVAYRTVTDDL